MRRLLFAVAVLGAIGMDVELVLLGHIDGALQILPVALLALAAASLVWLTVRPGGAAVAAVRAICALSVASGVVGVGLHLRGNMEFEREMYPTLSGPELLGAALTGATPVLAPGSMALLGLVCLAVTFRLPAAGTSSVEGMP